MNVIAQYAEDGMSLPNTQITALLDKALLSRMAASRRVLLLVPDHTRLHSYAGQLANQLYHAAADHTEVFLLPALGTHHPMTPEQLTMMYGDIPHDRFLVHDWRNGVKEIGIVPGEKIAEWSQGILVDDLSVEVSRHLFDDYDLIVSIGQVVPHEVVGMANYTKNIVVGCGGPEIINQSHFIGAAYGLERLLGKDHSPVRQLYDYIEAEMLQAMPITYLLTVTAPSLEGVQLKGLFAGRDRQTFEAAVALSQKVNMTRVDAPLKKVVVWLDPEEFTSTWVGNKAIYRTRKAIADGGELIILAEGVDTFGEDASIDTLIRRYGYSGREHIMQLTQSTQELQMNLSASAHLIHGSHDGRFTVTYCPRHLSQADIEGVGYHYMPYQEAAERYFDPTREEGMYETPDGEPYYFIKYPALGLWSI